MAYMFLPFSIIRKCVLIFHEQHNQGWLILATFDSKWVRPWAAPWSRLTCSHRFRLLGSAYLYSCALQSCMAHMFPPLSTQAVRKNYSHFICDASKSDMFPPFPIIRKCVLIFHEQHSHGWHVPATFDSQWVRNLIPWAAPLSRFTCSRHFPLLGSSHLYSWGAQPWLTCFRHFQLRQCVIIPISFTTPASLTCFRHFWWSEGMYLYFMSSTVMADVFLPLLTLSGCVIPFHERRHDHGWHVPVIFDY